MKKPVNKIEDPSLAITAILADPRILKNLVEQLAKRHLDIGYSLEKVEPGWRAIETSSLEANVSGDTNLSSGNSLTQIPFTTCFLFTCIKGKKQPYNLTWVRSLS
ncbi:MAG: hypothetical protein ABI675_16375 [Chitinophagaceae bacterium]